MQLATLGLVMGASISLSVALWLVWRWWLPMIRQTSQRLIDDSLVRMGELGFNEPKLRFGLFLFEASLFLVMGVGYWKYMGLILTIVVVGIYFHLRSLVLTYSIDRRERLLRRQTLSLTAGLHGLTQSGLSLPQAILQIASQTPAPLGKQMQRVASNYRLGRPLNESISEVRSKLRLDAFSLLVTSITCSLKQGTPLGQSLMGVQEALEHRDQVERQLYAKTASARTSILILAVSPLFFLLLFAVWQPDFIELLFNRSSGKVLLALFLSLLYGGVAWGRNLLRIR